MKKLIFVLSLVLVAACNDIDDCSTNDEQDFLILRFFDIDDKTQKTVGFRFTAEDSPFQYVFLADTTISSEGDTTIVSDSTFILLPLNPEAPTTTFFFDSDTSSHQIEFSYETNISIFDPDCPPSFYFSNLDTVSYTFDSLSIPGTVTNSQLDTNVEVYF